MKLACVMPPERKALSIKDRLEPEAYGLQQDRRRFDAERKEHASILSRSQQQVSADRKGIERDRAILQRDAKVIRNLQIAAGRQVSKDLDDIVETRQHER